MNINPVFPGSYYIESGGKSILAGCPPEIVKVLIQKDLKAPDAILLPDRPVAQGESQTAIEFPLYHPLFFGNTGSKKPPLILLGNSRRVDAARALLNLTLFGPEKEQMESWGMSDEDADALSRETRWFHLKDDSGKRIELDQMIRACPFDDEPIDLGWIAIRRTANNTFEFQADGETETIDVTPPHEQAPPYPVTPDLTTTTLVKLGVEVLGGSTGFSATQAPLPEPSSSGTRYFAKSDQCHFRQPHPRRSLQFDLLAPIQSPDCRPHHPGHLPDDAAEVVAFIGPIGGKPARLLHIQGAHRRRNHQLLRTAHQSVSAERVTRIERPYKTPAALLLADGGEGQIHGDPADALESPADRVVFMHLDKLSDRFEAHFMTASSGKRFPVLRGETDYNLTRTIEFLLEYFPGMPPVWISNLLANQRVFTFNAGDVIIREGTKSEGYLYMILTGHAQVVHHDGRKKHYLATMEAGELIGEMSIISGEGQRNASVVALSPVIVTAISESSFREYIQQQKQEVELKSMWQNRELLQNFGYLKPLQQPVIRELSRHVTLEHLPSRPGPCELKKICDPYGLIMPLGKEITIKYETRTESMDPHLKPIMCHSNEVLVTERELQYLFLSAENAAKLRSAIPAFRFFWEEVLGLPIPYETRI